MTSTTVPAPTLRAHQAPVPAHQRAHRARVVRWSLANGKAIHRDALAALVGARAHSLAVPGAAPPGVAPEDPSVWTATDVGALLWVGAADWCAATGTSLPEADRVATTLQTYLRYLSAHRLLAPGSDPVAALRRAVTEYGGTPGRSSRHPSMRRREPAPVLPLA